MNTVFKSEKALYENNFNPYGFEWIEADDADNSIYVFLRKGKSEDEVLMSVLNLTPRTFDYKIGIEEGTKWKVILNSDAPEFGGSGVVPEIKWYEETPWNNKPNSMIVTLPPLSGIILKQTEKTKKNQVKRAN
ncbi:MAG: alpha amylase C-terminal domain-containing protein [Cloacibacterium normanense]|nr:alpha amylase C-terminal domain-containing protein [Cloacibacterium normanense]